MKRSFFIVAASAIVSFLLASAVAWALPAEGVVQNAQIRPAGQTTLRMGSEGQLVSGNTAGDYYEAARLAEVFSCKTASAGTSLTTASASPLTAAGIIWLGVFNPVGSGYNIEIISSVITGISGTPGVGGTVYSMGCSQTAVTAVQNNGGTSQVGPLNHLTGQNTGSVAQCFTQLAFTGGTAFKEVRMHPYAPFGAAMAATTPGLSQIDMVNGALVVAPGCAIAIQAALQGTTHVAAGSIDFRQALP